MGDNENQDVDNNTTDSSDNWLEDKKLRTRKSLLGERDQK